MTRSRVRSGLRALLLVLGLVAVVAGLVTVLTGSGGMPGDSRATANVESELRFYSTFWVGFGAVSLWCARAPEQHALAVRALAFFLFLGGVARGLAWVADGRPDVSFLVLMALELTLPTLMIGASRRIEATA